jgi:trimethylamine:corrinoid methyltransferase-like protein
MVSEEGLQTIDRNALTTIRSSNGAREGSKDAATRANALWKSMLAEYEAPPLDQTKDEAIREFIDKRKASMPDATY